MWVFTVPSGTPVRSAISLWLSPSWKRIRRTAASPSGRRARCTAIAQRSTSSVGRVRGSSVGSASPRPTAGRAARDALAQVVDGPAAAISRIHAERRAVGVVRGPAPPTRGTPPGARPRRRAGSRSAPAGSRAPRPAVVAVRLGQRVGVPSAQAGARRSSGSRRRRRGGAWAAPVGGAPGAGVGMASAIATSGRDGRGAQRSDDSTDRTAGLGCTVEPISRGDVTHTHRGPRPGSASSPPRPRALAAAASAIGGSAAAATNLHLNARRPALSDLGGASPRSARRRPPARA